MTGVRRQPPKVPRPHPLERALSPTLAGIAAADDPPAAVMDFWQSTPAPLVEDVGVPGRLLVTFCWRDADAEQVLLFANRVTDETRLEESLMERLPGTDLWHVGYLVEPDWRASYSFLVARPGERAPWVGEGDQVRIRAALDRGEQDLRNDDRCRNRAGVAQSVVSLPDAPLQPWSAARGDAAEGTLEAFTAPLDRESWRYESAGADGDAPLVLVLDGEVWTGSQSLPVTIDNLVADGVVPPLRAVFLHSGGRDTRWREMGSEDGADVTVGYIVGHLLPTLADDGWVPADPARVAVVGQSLGGLSALRLALRRPDLCGVALSQSASLWLDQLEDEVQDVETHAADARRGGPRIHLAHGRQEWVLAPPHHRLRERLASAGVTTQAVEYNGGHDYAWWRGAVADGLVWAFDSGLE